MPGLGGPAVDLSAFAQATAVSKSTVSANICSSYPVVDRRFSSCGHAPGAAATTSNCASVGLFQFGPYAPAA